MKTRQILSWFIIILVLSIFTLIQRNDSNIIPNVNIGSPRWAIEYEQSERIVSQPIIFADRLYIQTKHKISVYEIIDGTLLWTAELPSENVQAGSWENVQVAVVDSQLIVQSQRNLISAFENNDGDLIWSSIYPRDANNSYSEAETFVVDMAAQNDYLLVSRHNTTVTAYNINDGRAIWASEVPTRTSLKIMSTDDRVYIGTLDTILTYDLSNGKLLDTYALSGDALSYTLKENKVYMTFDNGECIIAALDLATFHYDWCIRPNGINTGTHYIIDTIDNENMYIYGDKLICLNKFTGEILWSIKSEKEFEHIAISNNHIYAVDAGDLFVFDKYRGIGIKRLEIPIEITNSIFAPKLRWAPIVTKDLIILFADNFAKGYVIAP
jgi:outer membrane protein assembly factor BamB